MFYVVSGFSRTCSTNRSVDGLADRGGKNCPQGRSRQEQRTGGALFDR